ncbi:NADPH:quinone oxidoreductase family protein [Candidatus Entotheonella palauensis]|uniref:NADPH:quinone oxidoreductase family protein n=1 Tax=Candidatus Entotheonella palauensis TaxID=93172 RepID=UPI000B7C78A2|nr:NADPH:quinone oxidoreductase family protein [Candidatus Entotheonella palauensis]
MKAVLCEQLGSPEALVVRDIDSRTPGTGEVKVALKARGVSYVDVLLIAGQYQVKRELPFIPGSEAAGVVTEVGDRVESVQPGDRVLTPGGFAEEAVVAADEVTPLPDSVRFAAGAAFKSNYTTAYYGLQRGRLKAGEVLLIHGAAGGVGLAAVDMGKLFGATVIATASSEEKLAACKQMGADHVINYTEGFREQVKDLTGGRGADVIYDPVGGDVFDESMRCIAPYGRILIIGFTGGRPALAKTNHLLIKDAEAIGFTIGALSRYDPAWAKRNFEHLMGWLGSGRISPYVSHELPLEQAAEALQLITDRKVIGKAVLV